MYKKILTLAFFTGLLATTVYATVAATRNAPVLAPSNTIVVQNTSPMKLTFILETGSGRQFNLGSVASSEVLSIKDSSSLLAESANPKEQEYTIHAKDEKGGEFFTLLIDRDELLARGGTVQVPGPGGRRQQAMLAGVPTTVPMLTPVAVP